MPSSNEGIPLQVQASPSSARRQDAAFAAFCILCFFASDFILYPGFLTSDSIFQLAEARTGIFSDWHPPLMAWLWRNVEHLFPGKPAMLALQLGALWSGIYLCIAALQGRLIWRAALALILFLFPPVLGWAGAITKDSLMLGFALLGTGLVLRIDRERSRRVHILLPTIAFAFFLTCSARHNGLFLVAGLALMLGLLRVHSSGRKVAARTATFLFLLALLSSRLLDLALTEVRVYPAASLLSFDVSGISIRHSAEPHFRAKYQEQAVRAFLRPGHNLAELNDVYRPDDWLSLTEARTPRGEAPVLGRWNGERMNALLALWKSAVLEYPADYLIHRANVSLSLLAWGKRPVIDPACFSDRDPAHKAAASPMNDAHRVLSWRIQQLVQKTPLFRPWIYYLAGALLLSAVLLLRPKRWQIPAGLLLSGLLHESALFILTPAAEYRYSAWMMVAFMLASFSLLPERPSSATVEKQRRTDRPGFDPRPRWKRRIDIPAGDAPIAPDR